MVGPGVPEADAEGRELEFERDAAGVARDTGEDRPVV